MSADRRGRRPVLAGGGLAVGAGVAAAMVTAGVSAALSIAAGAACAAPMVIAGVRRPRASRRSTIRIDPFALGEPWRNFVARTEKADRQLRRTVDAVAPGPRRDRLDTIAARLEEARLETWRIARHGDELDDALRRLDPTALAERRSAILERPDDANRTTQLAAVDAQLATAARLRERSTSTAETLRVSASRFDELVARATEVAIDTSSVEAYEHDVDDLIIELESLRLAAEETDEA